MSNNPFAYIQNGIIPATGDGFIGRRRQLDEIIGYVTAPYPRHVSLYGLPRIGKTSLLQRVEQELAEQHADHCAPFYYPMGVNKSFQKNIQRIANMVAKTAGVSASQGDLTALEWLQSLLLEIGAGGRRVVLLLDEFERIADTWKQEEYESFVRLLLNQDSNLVCVTASRPRMSSVLSDCGYFPVINPFIPMLLYGFDDSEMSRYFALFPKKKAFGAYEMQSFLRICGRSPYLLTLMGNERFEDANIPVPEMFENCQKDIEDYFNQILRFMIMEEKRKKRSFSHVVKCYFGQHADYQDIKERCVSLGYLELSCKNSPYTYQGEEACFEFRDDSDRFTVIKQDGTPCTAAEKEANGLCYTTVSPLFVEYTFSVSQPIGKDEIIPLNEIEDGRDLLTGLVHVMRDITRQELSETQWGDDWNHQLLECFRWPKANATDEEFVYIDHRANGTFGYERWVHSGQSGQCTRLQNYGSNPGVVQMQLAGRTGPVIPMTCTMSFVLKEFYSGLNAVNPSVAAINLPDQCSIYTAFWNNTFDKYFGTAMTPQTLQNKAKDLNEYRNKLAHFSRYAITPTLEETAKELCRDLIKRIYYYRYHNRAYDQ